MCRDQSMLSTNAKKFGLIGGVVAVCALGVIGWARGRDRTTGNPYPDAVISSQPYQSSQPYNGVYAAQPLVQPVNGPVYESDGYYPSRMRPVYVRQNGPVQGRAIQPSQPSAFREQEYYTDSSGRRRGRSKTHSVEIVAGTAAVGAVIGALAGGGQGAAIGAASGAGAGFVYDRLTHRH